MPRYYIYRTTTDKVADSLNHITESGDSVVQSVHTGGRDWVLICTKSAAAEAVSRG